MISIIFSKDRALQLAATIESFLLHCQDTNSTALKVLYKASALRHQDQYEVLKRRYPEVHFIQETNFRQQVLSSIAGSDTVLFMVDDNIFVKPFCLRTITAILNEEKDAIGFSLRLGQNTTYCYPLHCPQQPPHFTAIRGGVLKYTWVGAQHDFGYPFEVSSSVYRTQELFELLRQLKFNNPNQLEGAMAAAAKYYAKARSALLCYARSVTFCNPINVVQTDNKNRYGTTHHYTHQELAQHFSDGLAIDVEKYAGFTPQGAHQEVQLHFKTSGKRPAFSIVMANYNNARFIDQAIQSVLNQTFNDWELIIVDDGSTDNSVEKIRTYLHDRRVRLIEHPQNRRYTAALKTGIANIRAELFGILDSDDALTSDAVKIMYEQHRANPDCGMIYSQFARCDRQLALTGVGFCGEIPPGKTNLDLNVVSHFKTFKLRDYLKTEGYDEAILYAEDKDISYKMEEVAKLKFVNQPLYLYRELPNSIGHAPASTAIGRQSMEKAKANAKKRRAAKSVPPLVEALRFYQQAQKALNLDDKPGAQQWIAMYRAHMDYSGLPVIDRRQEKTAPSASVIIVTYQRTGELVKLLDCLAGQTVRDFEIIVVDNGGTDIQIVAPKADCTVVCPIHFDLEEGQKIGASFARSQNVIFLDDNTRVCENRNASIIEKQSRPLVSIYMGAYNAQSYIRQAIESVLSQTFRDFELIVVDDGSTDRTVDVVESFKDSRIRLLRQEHKNFAVAMNTAISHARGEWIIGVDSDDDIDPDYLERMAGYALANPGFDYYYPASLFLNDPQKQYSQDRWDYRDFEDNRNLPPFLLMNGFSPIPNAGSLKRAAMFKTTGLYRELDAVEDFDFLARNALKIRFKRADGIAGYHYRINPAGNCHRFVRRCQVTAQILDEMIRAYSDEVLCPPLGKILPIEKEQKYRQFLHNVFQCLANRYAGRGGEVFTKAAEKYRTQLSKNQVQHACI
jgi:glycosyltransferase involved in cell wall biosynthesis